MPLSLRAFGFRAGMIDFFDGEIKLVVVVLGVVARVLSRLVNHWPCTRSMNSYPGLTAPARAVLAFVVVRPLSLYLVC